MTTATAQAQPNIAFIKYSGEKLDRIYRAIGFRAGKNITGGSNYFREDQDKTDFMTLAEQVLRHS